MGIRVIKGKNDLQTINPLLSSEWHPTKNGDLSPSDISTFSHENVWWLGKCGHEWQSRVDSRHTQGSSCPYCSNRLLLKGFNDLATIYPNIAAQWHPTKNGTLTPSDVLSKSGKKIWWMCSEGHEFVKSVNEMVRGRGCVYCAGQKAICGKNDLLTLYPDIASEWHPTKNGKLMANQVMPNTNRKVWWMCKFGHEWLASPSKRIQGRGCPICQTFNRTSFPEFVIFKYIKEIFPDAINSYHSTFLKNMELDIYIPSIKTGIEYDGIWHIVERDRIKDKICKENFIKLIRIRLSKTENYDRDDPTIIIKDNENESINDAINKLFSLLEIDKKCINTSKSFQVLFNEYRSIKANNNLLEIYPQLADEWMTEKNGISPDHIPATTSSKKYWWKCKKCGYEWEAQINNRINRIKGKNCPCCSGKVVMRGVNDLATINPELALEWHPTKNGDLKPYDVTKGSNKKVWWICSKCGNEFLSMINKRSSGGGCPCCSGKVVMRGVNDLATINPELALEWHPTKNGILRPTDVFPFSSKEVWWLGKCGHEWKCKIRYRSNGSGCPVCYSTSRGEKKRKVVLQLDDKMIPIKEYDSLTIATNETGITNISSSIKNKCKAGGFYWKYKGNAD